MGLLVPEVRTTRAIGSRRGSGAVLDAVVQRDDHEVAAGAGRVVVLGPRGRLDDAAGAVDLPAILEEAVEHEGDLAADVLVEREARARREADEAGLGDGGARARREVEVADAREGRVAPRRGVVDLGE